MDSVFNTYQNRFIVTPQNILEKPQSNLSIITVIPCYKEPDVCASLESLYACNKPENTVELIVVINHPEHASEEDKAMSIKTKILLEQWLSAHSVEWITTHIIFAPNLPKKHAGVGLARKIGMDEAARRFATIQNKQGVITAFDADSRVEKNYFTEIESYFNTNPKIAVAPIHFEHPLSGTEIPILYDYIAQYELHLRLYIQLLAEINFPYAFHTVGSSMSVRAYAYCEQGGMNKRQAGEDFYFLHKLFQSYNTGSITNTQVIPGVRISDRVPFGTGFAMKTLLAGNQFSYKTYSIESYRILEKFFILCMQLYKENKTIDEVYSNFHAVIQDFISLAEFTKKISEIVKNVTNEHAFTKRFFTWVNGFFVFKFLNFAHVQYFEKVDVLKVSQEYLKNENVDIKEHLKKLRHLQK